MDRRRADFDLNAVPVNESRKALSQAQYPLPPLNPGPSSSRPVPMHPRYISFINDLRENVYRVSVQREELKLERMHLRDMINSLHLRAQHLAQENEVLKRKIEEISAYFR